jgi:hypothetical protein
VTCADVIEEVAGALADSEPFLQVGGRSLLPDDYRRLATTAFRKIQELRLQVVMGDDAD